MGLTSIDFNQIENINNTPTGLNINKAINFTQQLVISSVPPAQENTSNIWFNKTTEELKIRINNTTYDLKPKETLSNITISSNLTLNLNGKRGIVNNLTVTGTNTVLTVRTGSLGWSLLEVQGNLTIASGCTLNLIRTPLIVRGNIIGGGTISSPNGVNGGLGGIGGPGGTGGDGGYENGLNGSNSPSTWPNMSGGPSSLMPIEYGVSSGGGGLGGRGGAGGGGGGGGEYGGDYAIGGNGGNSGNNFSGGPGYVNLVDIVSNGYLIRQEIYTNGGGGGGSGGNGTSAGQNYSNASGGSGSNATSGIDGGIAGTLSNPYIGIGTPSSRNVGTSGAFGGAGGQGAYNVQIIYYPSQTGQNFSNRNPSTSGGWPGSPGGTGGNGGPGGSTGGAHLTIFCVGTIDASTIFRPGKGGINGGLSSGPKAQTGSLWLFSQYGTNLSPNASIIDLTGIGPSPSGSAGTSNRISITDSTSVNSFFRDILYNSNGATPAKDVISLTI